jgi:hypothetical protein
MFLKKFVSAEHASIVGKPTDMQPQTMGLRVNPSDETIRLGPLAVRFLITGEHSSGSVAAFELIVPGAARLAAPAHCHDHALQRIAMTITKRQSTASTEC